MNLNIKKHSFVENCNKKTIFTKKGIIIIDYLIKKANTKWDFLAF